MTTMVYTSVDKGETRLPGASILMLETTRGGKRGDEEHAVLTRGAALPSSGALRPRLCSVR